MGNEMDNFWQDISNIQAWWSSHWAPVLTFLIAMGILLLPVAFIPEKNAAQRAMRTILGFAWFALFALGGIFIYNGQTPWQLGVEAKQQITQTLDDNRPAEDISGLSAEQIRRRNMQNRPPDSSVQADIISDSKSENKGFPVAKVIWTLVILIGFYVWAGYLYVPALIGRQYKEPDNSGLPKGLTYMDATKHREGLASWILIGLSLLGLLWGPIWLKIVLWFPVLPLAYLLGGFYQLDATERWKLTVFKMPVAVVAGSLPHRKGLVSNTWVNFSRHLTFGKPFLDIGWNFTLLPSWWWFVDALQSTFEIKSFVKETEYLPTSAVGGIGGKLKIKARVVYMEHALVDNSFFLSGNEVTQQEGLIMEIVEARIAERMINMELVDAANKSNYPNLRDEQQIDDTRFTTGRTTTEISGVQLPESVLERISDPKERERLRADWKLWLRRLDDSMRFRVGSSLEAFEIQDITAEPSVEAAQARLSEMQADTLTQKARKELEVAAGQADSARVSSLAATLGTQLGCSPMDALRAYMMLRMSENAKLVIPPDVSNLANMLRGTLGLPSTTPTP